MNIELTRREHDVLRLLYHGQSNHQISYHLNISKRTVEAHVSSMLSKTGTRDRHELAGYARQHRILDKPPVRT